MEMKKKKNTYTHGYRKNPSQASQTAPVENAAVTDFQNLPIQDISNQLKS
jgi:hypothetical protein